MKKKLLFALLITSYLHLVLNQKFSEMNSRLFITVILKDELENIDCLMVWHKKVNKEFLKILKKLKFVVRYGVGYDNIDLKILKKLIFQIIQITG